MLPARSLMRTGKKERRRIFRIALFVFLFLSQNSSKHTFQPRVFVGCLPLVAQPQVCMIAHKALNLFFIFLHAQGASYVGKLAAGLQQAHLTIKNFVLQKLVIHSLLLRSAAYVRPTGQNTKTRTRCIDQYTIKCPRPFLWQLCRIL